MNCLFFNFTQFLILENVSVLDLALSRVKGLIIWIVMVLLLFPLQSYNSMLEKECIFMIKILFHTGLFYSSLVSLV